jgi:peptidoglycan/xylan/chitin deacetylase (PgdA/CDA1 family)
VIRPGLVLVAAAAVAAVAAGGAFGSRDDGAVRRPHVALQWEQHRAVAALARSGRVVFCGGGRSNAVALTFDDGPGPYTERLVRILRAEDARATFFVVGNQMPYRTPVLRELTTVGVLGNHSWSHAHLTELPPLFAWLDVLRAQHDARASIGWKPRLFRAPYERRSAALDRIVRRMGLLQVYWSVDSRDWIKGTTAAKVVRRVVPQLRPGAIVVLHDIHPWTVDAVPAILRAIRLRGLRAVTVPELLALDPPPPGSRCAASATAP